MRCSIPECLGEYEEWLLNHTARHQGEDVVIGHVPTEICSECGHVQFKQETLRRLEELLATTNQASKTAPHYEYSTGGDRNDP